MIVTKAKEVIRVGGTLTSPGVQLGPLIQVAQVENRVKP